MQLRAPGEQQQLRLHPNGCTSYQIALIFRACSFAQSAAMALVLSASAASAATITFRIDDTDVTEGEPSRSLSAHLPSAPCCALRQWDARFEPYQSTRLSRYNAGPKLGCGYAAT
jgi:hypothetical protein